MLTGQMVTEKGYCYSWMGKPVPRETRIKPMSWAWREYSVQLATLAEKNERGMLEFKINVLRKYFAGKGEQYVSIVRHLEVIENW